MPFSVPIGTHMVVAVDPLTSVRVTGAVSFVPGAQVGVTSLPPVALASGASVAVSALPPVTLNSQTRVMADTVPLQSVPPEWSFAAENRFRETGMRLAAVRQWREAAEELGMSDNPDVLRIASRLHTELMGAVETVIAATLS